MVPVLTPDGLEKIKKELDYLKNKKRREISEKIEKAKELGDLSENAEYHEAKDEQGMVEARIKELEGLLKSAVVSEASGSKEEVGVGSEVVVKSKFGEQTYKIVGYNEANPSAGFISNESPLGSAFLGKRKGQVVEVEVPAGVISYEIIEIR
ncbi:MAG TPA: transcription elongation factor GreA [Candidatus Bipolaricaulota bacterium]|nr:transcription elongation factor GreA [Candidatus Bipolaricaulota bacterium]